MPGCQCPITATNYTLNFEDVQLKIVNFYHMDTQRLEKTIPIDGVGYYRLSKTNLFVSKSVLSAGP